jgi:Tfp pilus assembly protein PilX
MKYNVKNKKGFTLLMAILISSVLLLLGASMFQFATKQIILSSIGRDSQFAFYAADTGAECALYWDYRFDAFGTTSAPVAAQCDNQSIGNLRYAGDGIPNSFEFNPNGYCAKVTVTKTGARTVIDALGYSTACENIATNARALERAVQLRY